MNAKHGYTINIQFSKEDDCYIASVPELGPYISAFGNSYEEALKEIQIVIDLTIQSYKDDKIPLPKPKSIKKAI